MLGIIAIGFTNYFSVRTLLSSILKVCFALPVYQAINLTGYAMTQRGWAARVGMFLVMVPVFVITTGCWVIAWYMTLSLIFLVVR